MKITCSKSKTICVLNYLPHQKAPRKYAAIGKEGGSRGPAAGGLRIRRHRMHYKGVKKLSVLHRLGAVKSLRNSSNLLCSSTVNKQ